MGKESGPRTVRTCGCRLGGPTAANECLELEVGEQDHQRLALISNPASASTPAKSARARSADRAPRARGPRAIERAVVQRVHRTQLLLGRPAHPRCGEVDQPDDVIGGDVVPRRAQHVGPHHAAVIEQPGEICTVRRRRPRRHGPRRLRRILRLDREQRPDHLGCSPHMRRDQMLGAEAPACEVTIAEHVSGTAPDDWTWRMHRRRRVATAAGACRDVGLRHGLSLPQGAWPGSSPATANTRFRRILSIKVHGS